MFDTISESLGKALDRFKGRGKLTEKNIREGMRQVRSALLEADVHFQVVKDFMERVTDRAVGRKVLQSIKPGQQVVQIVQEELETLMSPPDPDIPTPENPTILMLAGLQGSGKTTMAAKLAVHLTGQGHRPLLVAADVQRPAAVAQLQTLGRDIDVPVYSEPSDPPSICQNSVAEAFATDRDVIILDTAGRLHLDETLMGELEVIARTVNPHQIYLVCDALTGQDAVTSASEFNRRLEIDGVILTKLDGDARGGAALSVRAVTGKPIKLVGVGEKPEDLEPFHPDRMASRILGMGDVVGLVERAQSKADQEAMAKVQERMLKAEMTLEDFLVQLQQVKRMGQMGELLGMIPGLGKQLKKMQFDEAENEQEMKKMEAIIQSMTPHERSHPQTIEQNRRKRIASGSGTRTQDVGRLLKEFKQMKKMMKGMKKGMLKLPFPF